MSKVAIITDTHFGAGNDSEALFKYFEKFYKNVFFPSLDESGVDTLLMLGDTFDKRRVANYLTVHRSKKMFFDPLKQRNIKVYMVIGNHDCYFKNTNDVNSPNLLLGEYDNITIISHPEIVEVKGTDVCFIPWIADDEEARQDARKELTHTSAKICMGHLEIQGFAMWRNKEGEMGETPRELFRKFDVVFSGHYHHKNAESNIHYLGNPYEMTWADYQDERGFHYFDLETLELEFVKNPYALHYKIEYGEDGAPDIDLDELKDCKVKVIIKNKDDVVKCDRFLRELERQDYSDLKIEDTTIFEIDESKIQNVEGVGDSMQMITSYIDSIENYTDEMKDSLKKVMSSLYAGAMEKEIT